MSAYFFGYLPLLLYISWAAAYCYCSNLCPRSFFTHPRAGCYLIGIAMMLPAGIFKLYFPVLGTFALHIIIFLLGFLLFEDRFRIKLACFLSLFLLLFLTESIAASIYMSVFYFQDTVIQPSLTLHKDAPFELLTAAAINIVVGIFVFRKAVPLLAHFLPCMHTRTMLLLCLPLLAPMIAQGLIIYKQQSPWYPAQVFLYWLICLMSYPAFHLGIKSLKLQEHNRLLKEQELAVTKKQLDFSREMEKEYQSLRKWNHDIENHLLSLSYLMDARKYDDAKSYCATLLQAKSCSASQEVPDEK